QYVTYEYPAEGKGTRKRLLVFEQRIWSPYRQEGHENGDVFYGTKGMMILGKGGGYQLFGERNKLIKEEKWSLPFSPHQRDFLDAIKAERKPNADIEIGHHGAALAHLGNLVARLGRVVTFDPRTEQVVGDEQANRLCSRSYRMGHWAVPRVD
ncbi:MAG: gfo/Idh/MocA family oxidoreductase, partial [Phycisphaerae bacterium]